MKFTVNLKRPKPVTTKLLAFSLKSQLLSVLNLDIIFS